MADPSEYEVKLNGIVVGKISKTGNQEADSIAALDLIKSAGLYKESSTAQRALGQAKSFADTSAHLYERGLRMGAIVPTMLAPFVVNSAFAIEVYLKALSEAHAIKTHGHIFVKLFDALPSETKDRLEQLAPDFAKRYKAETFSTFRESLIKLEGAFVVWRYIYESDAPASYDVPLAIATMAALHERCSEVVKR